MHHELQLANSNSRSSPFHSLVRRNGGIDSAEDTKGAFELQNLRTLLRGSNWGKESILGIYDFANVLLGSILDCPLIPKNTRVRLIYFHLFDRISSYKWTG